MKVKILCGVSGSGKSTYIKNNFPRAFVCSADNFFMKEGEYKFDPSKLSEAHGDCLIDFVNMVFVRHSDVTVVVDNTNTTVAEIAPYAALALAYGCDLEIIILEPKNIKTAAARNVHNVPESVVVQQAKRLGELKLPPWWPARRVEV